MKPFFYFKHIHFLLLASACLFACTQQPTTQKVTTAIQFFKKGTEAFQDSSMLTMTFYYQDGQKRHLLDASTRKKPVHMPFIATAWDSLGLFYQIMAQCSIGDSVSFALTAEEFFIHTKGTPDALPQLNLHPEDSIYFYARFKSQMSLEDFFHLQDSLEQQQFQTYIDQTKERNQQQANAIDAFLKERGMTATTSSSGLKYVVLKEGNGPIATLGDEVTIHYEGKLLNGYVFGSSYDKDMLPITFQIGSGEVIAAWDEAARIFPIGTQALVMAPSDLGFGFAERYDVPSSSILCYTFEVIDVRKNDKVQ